MLFRSKIYKAEGNLDVWSKLIINTDFADVYFTTEQKGFAISSGVNGILFKTENGGTDWQVVSGAPGGGDILFLDSLTGFIAGSDSKIYKTTDGGESWYATNGVPNIIAKIDFINSSVGWAAGGFVIIKTTDGGENWETQITLQADHFTSIFMIDSLNGWATSRYVWQTTDGGENWIERTDIPALFSTDIYFSDEQTGWTTDDFTTNRLLQTTDGGLNWFEVSEVIDPFEFYLFPDPVHWIISGVGIGGGGYIVFYTYITTDGGNSWNDISNDVPSGFSGFQAPTNNLGYAVGGTGLILRYDDTTYVPVELISFEGKTRNNKVVLYWATASELNNQGFYIEKSYDKIKWETIGFVNGNGTTTERNYYSFVDTNPANGKINYRLKQQDYDGSFKYSKVITIFYTNTPLSFELFQNYPNPFNPTTTIKYSIPKKDVVNISLYTILGDKIAELINEEKQPGVYRITLSANKLASGIYFYKMITGSGFASVKKLTIIK